MGDPAFESVNIILPLQNTDNVKHGCVIAVTSSADAADLSSLLTNWDKGGFLTLIAIGATVWVALADDDSTDISSSATGNGNTVALPIPDGGLISGRIKLRDGSQRYLKHQGSGAGKLYVWVTSAERASEEADV